MDFDFGAFGDLVGGAFSHQVTQFTVAFGLAAFFHSKQIRKEIRAQFEGMRSSIDAVAKALGDDLRAQKEITGKLVDAVTDLKGEVNGINDRVIVLEKK